MISNGELLDPLYDSENRGLTLVRLKDFFHYYQIFKLKKNNLQYVITSNRDSLLTISDTNLLYFRPRQINVCICFPVIICGFLSHLKGLFIISSTLQKYTTNQ